MCKTMDTPQMKIFKYHVSINLYAVIIIRFDADFIMTPLVLPSGFSPSEIQSMNSKCILSVTSFWCIFVCRHGTVFCLTKLAALPHKELCNSKKKTFRAIRTLTSTDIVLMSLSFICQSV